MQAIVDSVTGSYGTGALGQAMSAKLLRSRWGLSFRAETRTFEEDGRVDPGCREDLLGMGLLRMAQRPRHAKKVYTVLGQSAPTVERPRYG